MSEKIIHFLPCHYSQIDNFDSKNSLLEFNCDFPFRLDNRKELISSALQRLQFCFYLLNDFVKPSHRFARLIDLQKQNLCVLISFELPRTLFIKIGLLLLLPWQMDFVAIFENFTIFQSFS